MGDAEYLDAFQRVIMPIAQEFNPDIVIGVFNLFTFLNPKSLLTF